jgi:hypothetical protein
VVTHPFAVEVTDWVAKVVEVAEILLGEGSKQTNGSKGLIAAAKQIPANAGTVRSFISSDKLD